MTLTTRRTVRDEPDTARADDSRALWPVVARREILVRLSDRAFLLGSAAMLVVIAAVMGFQVYLSERTTEVDVAVTTSAEAEMATAAVEEAEGEESITVDLVRVDDDAAARAAVEDETASVWLRAEAEGGWTLVSRDGIDLSVQRLVEDVVRSTTLAQNAAEAGTSVAELTAGSELELEQREGDADLATLRLIVGFGLALLFYFSSMIFGMTLAQSVVEEKQTRIVEMIAAAVPLRQLLAGKVVGNTALALGQLSLYAGVGLIGLSFTDHAALVGTLTGAVGWFLAFFLVGFVALACLFAVAGAVATRNEDLQHTTLPAQMMLFAAFLGTVLLEGTAETVASFVPPFSALAMPVRLVDGTAAWWEASAALALLLGFAAVLVLLAERLYRRALLQTGGRLSLRQAWRLEE